jgi:LacI family transcriptional regulator
VNDQAALHLYDAATTIGLRIPSDLSIIGFDWSLRWVPSGGHITTVCQHFDDIGRIAVDRLLEKIGSHEDQVPRQILVEGSLIQKGSTSPLPLISLKTH